MMNLDNIINPPKQALPEGKEICETCDTVVATETAVEHAKTHEPKPEFKVCEYCGKSYKRSHTCKKKKEAQAETNVLFASPDTAQQAPPFDAKTGINQAAEEMRSQGIDPVCVSDNEQVNKAVIGEKFIGTLFLDCVPQDRVVYVWDGETPLDCYFDAVAIITTRVRREMTDLAISVADRVVVGL